tara:strand:- start:1423 stop:2631 length:1209 start_codon:yes stop_codon:yes gene_type:complete
MVAAYYNEFDKHAAEWLRNLIREGLIADGDVDERPIQEVKPDDLSGYTQCHFFAGIGGWSYALRLAGWSDERPVWTGSCPCQSFSQAGKKQGASDSERHLWPDWFRLIEKCQPPTVFGEQVAGAVGFGWLDAVATDFESQDYAFASAVLSGFTVGAHHKRQRLWFVGHSEHDGSSPPTVRGSVEASGNDTKKGSNISVQLEGTGRSNNDGSLDKLADSQIVECDDGFSRNFAETHEKNGVRGKVGTGRSVDKKCLADSDQSGREAWIANGVGKKSHPSRDAEQFADESAFVADSQYTRSQGRLRGRSNKERQSVNRHVRRCSAVDWEAVEWVECQDGKTRPIPVEPGIQPLVNGLPKVVDREGNTHEYSFSNALKGIGNAIIPAVAAEFINVYMDIALDGST